MRPIDIIKKVCPRARPNYLTAIERGDELFMQHHVDTPARIAPFLATICHESGGLTIEWESGNYSAERIVQIFGVGHHSAAVTQPEAAQLAHNGPALFERVYGAGNPRKMKELGNAPGDGYRLRGGGLMQTTGGANYKRIGEKIGVDLYHHPELLLSPEHALKPALIEWTEGGLNAYADRGDFLAISRAINIGNPHSPETPNNWADRQKWLAKIRPLCVGLELRLLPETPAATPAPQPSMPLS